MNLLIYISFFVFFSNGHYDGGILDEDRSFDTMQECLDYTATTESAIMERGLKPGVKMVGGCLPVKKPE